MLIVASPVCSAREKVKMSFSELAVIKSEATQIYLALSGDATGNVPIVIGFCNSPATKIELPIMSIASPSLPEPIVWLLKA